MSDSSECGVTASKETKCEASRLSTETTGPANLVPIGSPAVEGVVLGASGCNERMCRQHTSDDGTFCAQIAADHCNVPTTANAKGVNANVAIANATGANAKGGNANGVNANGGNAKGGGATSVESTKGGGSGDVSPSGSAVPKQPINQEAQAAMLAHAAQLAQSPPKRLHVSNIPFRFREADLKTLLGVCSFLGSIFSMASLCCYHFPFPSQFVGNFLINLVISKLETIFAY